MSRPYSRVIQLVKHSQDGGAIDTVTMLALCEDGSIWFFFPALKNPWEMITEMDGGRYVGHAVDDVREAIASGDE